VRLSSERDCPPRSKRGKKIVPIDRPLHGDEPLGGFLFEAWARGRLSKDTMANVLYTEYLDKTITHWNKELEEIRFSYSTVNFAAGTR
jgi:hypothetical protein